MTLTKWPELATCSLAKCIVWPTPDGGCIFLVVTFQGFTTEIIWAKITVQRFEAFGQLSLQHRLYVYHLINSGL